MTYTGSGSVVTKVDLDNLAVAAVNGYPFIFYGHDIYGNHMDGQPPKFPAQLKAMRSLTVDLNYTLAVEKAPANLNIAFDQRLMPASTYASGASGSLEVMVALYFNFSWGAAGHFVQTVTVPVTVNGVQSPVVFNVYMTGWGPGNLVVIYPQDSQFTSGDIRFDMLPLLKTAAAVAGIDQTWYVPGLMFGTEFGASKTAKYTFTVNKFSFEQQ